VRTKCAQKTRVGLWRQYDYKELTRVSTAGPELDKVLQVVSETSLVVSRVCGLLVRVYGACGPEVVT
jgi:hypothetical protein